MAKSDRAQTSSYHWPLNEQMLTMHKDIIIMHKDVIIVHCLPYYCRLPEIHIIHNLVPWKHHAASCVLWITPNPKQWTLTSFLTTSRCWFDQTPKTWWVSPLRVADLTKSSKNLRYLTISGCLYDHNKVNKKRFQWASADTEFRNWKTVKVVLKDKMFCAKHKKTMGIEGLQKQHRLY